MHNRSIILHFRPFLCILHYILWNNVVFYSHYIKSYIFTYAFYRQFSTYFVCFSVHKKNKSRLRSDFSPGFISFLCKKDFFRIVAFNPLQHFICKIQKQFDLFSIFFNDHRIIWYSIVIGSIIVFTEPLCPPL